jgi:hypothetical protein
MTLKDIHIYFNQEYGHYPKSDEQYISWLEENLVLVTNCLEKLGASLDKGIKNLEEARKIMLKSEFDNQCN